MSSYYQKCIEQDDRDCEAVLKKVMASFGKQVKKSVAARRAAGIPDPVIDTSPERQAEVIAGIKKEMDRLRPMKDKLIGRDV